MPSVKGILETALYVSDVRKAADFYQRLFGFSVLLESQRLVALDVAGRDVLLLFLTGATNEPFPVDGGIIPGHGPGGKSHFAFAIGSADVDHWQSRLAENQVPVESIVQWPGGASSIYFRDLDQNLVELMTPGFWANYR